MTCALAGAPKANAAELEIDLGIPKEVQTGYTCDAKTGNTFALGCFNTGGDVLYIADWENDSMRVAVHWRLADGTRRGLCISLNGPIWAGPDVRLGRRARGVQQEHGGGQAHRDPRRPLRRDHPRLQVPRGLPGLDGLGRDDGLTGARSNMRKAPKPRHVLLSLIAAALVAGVAPATASADEIVIGEEVT